MPPFLHQSPPPIKEEAPTPIHQTIEIQDSDNKKPGIEDHGLPMSSEYQPVNKLPVDRHEKSGHPCHPGWCKISGGGVKFLGRIPKKNFIGVKKNLGGVKAR